MDIMDIFVKCIGAFVIVVALIFFIMGVVGLFIRDVIRPKDGPLKNYVNFVDGMHTCCIIFCIIMVILIVIFLGIFVCAWIFTL